MDALDKKFDTGQTSIKHPLFIDNKMVLRYKDIMDTYNNLAILRIRMNYLILNMKIHILESLSLINYTKGNRFRSLFNYNKLQYDNKVMTIIIELYCLAYEVIDNLYLLKNIYNQYQANSSGFLKTIENLDLDYLKNIYYKSNVNSINEFNKYYNELNNISIFAINFLQQLKENNKQHIDILSNDLDIRIHGVKNIINKLIIEYDPHLECQYYMVLGSSNDTNIYPIGISASIYLGCDEEISLETKNINFDDTYLNTMEEKDFRDIFVMKKVDSSFPHFLQIIPNTLKINNLKFNYYICDAIPNNNINLTIDGLPNGYRFLSSIIKNNNCNINCNINYNINCNINYQDIPPPINTSNYLLKKNNNKHLCMSKEEYQNLDSSLKKKYCYNNTKLNIFSIDYLFNELLHNDESGVIIEPEMIDSFKTLAVNISI